MTLNEFYLQIKDWLLPLGYTEIWCNHPCITPREYHFCKEGIRVCCVNDTEPYFYLHYDIIQSKPSYAIITGKYELNSPELPFLVEHLKMVVNRLL